MKQYFISHDSESIVQAVELKQLLKKINDEHAIFLTSDWYSIEAGNLWMNDIIKSLQEMDEMIVLITRKETFNNLWLNFELGAAIGRGIKPKILVFGGIDLKEMKYPMKGIHVIITGDTNRWVMEFNRIGYAIKNTEPFAKLFGQTKEV